MSILRDSYGGLTEGQAVRAFLATTLTCITVTASALGQDYRWQPAPQPSIPGHGQSTCPVTLDRPIAVTIDRPIPLTPIDRGLDPQVVGASFQDSLIGAPQASYRAQAPDVPGPALNPPPPSPVYPPPPSPAYPAPTAPVYPGPVPGPALPPVPPPGSTEPFNCGQVTQPPGPAGHGFWDKCRNLFSSGQPSEGRSLFQSDHSFDDVGMISPVSNPFLFLDPRSLTEVRPIFMWQQTPSSNPIFRGGDIEYAGLQASLAVTPWLSLNVTKLGWIWSEPSGDTDGFESHSGFAELWLDPQVTFYRNCQCGTILAAGLQFQIPAGSGDVQQDTGTLSLAPYISYGQNFGRSSYGSFNFLNTTGYSFSVDHDRTDYFYTSFHLDYDIARLHKIYPLIELNYFNYTEHGDTRALAFEGRDLFNFGSTGVDGRSELTMAIGARYLFCQAVQTGIVAEFPLLGNHELQDFRLTVDLIFRY